MSQGRQRRTGTSRSTSLFYKVCPSKPLGNLGTSRGSNLARTALPRGEARRALSEKLAETACLLGPPRSCPWSPGCARQGLFLISPWGHLGPGKCPPSRTEYQLSHLPSCAHHSGHEQGREPSSGRAGGAEQPAGSAARAGPSRRRCMNY